jgi:hypothetical protein
MIERDYPSHNFEYICRNPPVSAIQHFQLTIFECEEKHMVMFHDDDMMHPDYVETMFPFIQKEGVSAKLVDLSIVIVSFIVINQFVVWFLRVDYITLKNHFHCQTLYKFQDSKSYP